MELQQLRNFIGVVEHKNISRAARELLISQPTLSRSIHALEEDLGVTLFQRGSYGIALTRQGELLAQRAREILDMESRVKQEVLSAAGEEPFTIRLIYRCVENFLVDILSQYRRQRPQVSFTILQNDDIALQNHQYDLVVSGGLADESGYLRQRLLTERFLCALPAGHPLADRACITREEFAALPQIRFGGHRQIQWLIKRELEQRGLVLPVRCICDDVRTGCSLVAAGFGALLIPEYAPDANMLGQIRLLPVEGIDISREVYLYRRSNTYLPEYVNGFAAFLVRYFERVNT